ncbi:helix-turn-helix domain-containing protein [Actinoallomurus sp. NPDC050550]|uniref:helix-turn-helix domain-containing protein n=1 Tax=Actinoallomurus sp. NPDC050550 TaxID=3154937 RepID=UPI0033DDF93E
MGRQTPEWIERHQVGAVKLHDQIRHARALLAQPDATIARLLGVSRATIYKYVPELKTGQRPQLDAGAPSAARAELPAS